MNDVRRRRMAGTIGVERDDRICTLTIDNPEKRNALSPSMLERLTETLEDLEDVRVVVLESEGTKAFCSGFDIDAFSGSAGIDAETEFAQAIRSIRSFEYPIVAMIDGDAIGGGFELACACDLRFAVDTARFGITPAKLGIIYSERGIRQFLNTIGPTHAKELLFTADLFGAERMLEAGLLNGVSEEGAIEAMTYETAESIASNAPLSLTGMKTICNHLLDEPSISDETRAEFRQLREAAYDSDDYKRAREAFAKGERPEFTGE